MKQYNIHKKVIDFDETKTYLDFYLTNGKQNLVTLNLEKCLEDISVGKIETDENLKNNFILLERWTREAPRKRFYRNLRREGIQVLSTEQFFDLDEGEEIINNLENTGVFAQYFLKEVYDLKLD